MAPLPSDNDCSNMLRANVTLMAEGCALLAHSGTLEHSVMLLDLFNDLG